MSTGKISMSLVDIIKENKPANKARNNMPAKGSNNNKNIYFQQKSSETSL